MVHFGEFLKTLSLRSSSVTRQVSFNRTKNWWKMPKIKNSITTFWAIFKQKNFHDCFAFFSFLRFFAQFSSVWIIRRLLYFIWWSIITFTRTTWASLAQFHTILINGIDFLYKYQTGYSLEPLICLQNTYTSATISEKMIHTAFMNIEFRFFSLIRIFWTWNRWRWIYRVAKQVLDLDKTKKNPDFGSGFWIRILDPMLDPKLAGSPCRFQT